MFLCWIWKAQRFQTSLIVAHVFVRCLRIDASIGPQSNYSRSKCRCISLGPRRLAWKGPRGQGGAARHSPEWRRGRAIPHERSAVALRSQGGGRWRRVPSGGVYIMCFYVVRVDVMKWEEMKDLFAQNTYTFTDIHRA